SAISKAAFQNGLIIETSGPNDEVIKTLPPLTISQDQLARGLEVLAESAREVTTSKQLAAAE
ncbi:MAG: hypothetical protein KDB23_30740, partial [Planctomycetales bacterium]|nr:hypothetical protein [Planctomycetales bacterium]